MIRTTTSGLLKSYRYNLMRSTHNRNQAQNTVLTGRKFNTFAENPATAARCFQLRRSLERVTSQYTVGQSVVRKYEVAWSTLDTVVGTVDNLKGDSSLTAIMHAASDTSGAGRNALGQELVQIAENIVQTMNAKYGDNFVFAGADGLEVPFTFEGGVLCYRGINVDTAVPEVVLDANGDPALNANGEYDLADGSGTITVAEYEQLETNLATLKYMAEEEEKFADIGLGLEEDDEGNMIDTSAFNVALQGITFLGYGVDEDGLPNNIVSVINEMGEVLKSCTPEGAWPSEEVQEKFFKLFDKFSESADVLSDKHVEMDTRAAFLKDNQELLESNSYNLQEQIVELEDEDPAKAITDYSWAQYCYNAALKVGNSILSQSLMDYLNT